MTWHADYAKEAFHEGKQAFRDGGGDNPHIIGGYQFSAWNQGYEAARDIAPLEKITRILEGAA